MIQPNGFLFQIDILLNIVFEYREKIFTDSPFNRRIIFDHTKLIHEK